MRRNHIYEFLFVVLAIATIFLGLSLFSYSASDPSYSNIVFSRYDDTVNNVFGKAGAYAADFMGAAFGWPALLIPFGLIYLLVQVVKVYRGRATGKRLAVACGAVFLFIVTASVLSGLVGENDLFFADKQNGGIFGVAGAVVIKSLLGKAGGIILCIIILILCAMAIAKISFTSLAGSISWKLGELRGKEKAPQNKELPRQKKEKPALLTKVSLFLKKLKHDREYKKLEKKRLKAEKEAVELATFENAEAERKKMIQAPVQKPETEETVGIEPVEKLEKTAGYKNAELPPLIVPPFTPSLIEPGIQEPETEDQEIEGEYYEMSLQERYGLLEGEEFLTVSKLEELLNRQEEQREQNAEEDSYVAPVVGEYPQKVPSANNIKNTVTGEDYSLPFNLLDLPSEDNIKADPAELRAKADLLLNKLRDFGVDGRIREIRPGPVVTLFELEPAPGIKINKIANLENDLALAMSAMSIRIIAPIPGKAAVGIEVPNADRSMVSMRELLEAKEFKQDSSPLAVALGKDISGKPYFTDLRKMPHLLVAGTTGSGKSVCVNSIICSVLYKSSPEAVKFVMIDPKMVELSVYEGIPHLMAPVVTDPRKAAVVLQNVVREMEQRYSLLASCKVRSIESYKNYMLTHPELNEMPYMVVIVDEFADLMMVAGKEVENSIIRIAQMARAVGIHLVLATQRPSVNVITGIIKANMPARISFRVSSKIDSRTILDQNGAELLLGKGDSLFIPPGSSDPLRIHGCFVSEQEVLRVVDELKVYGEPEYNMNLLEDGSAAEGDFDDEDIDSRYEEALQIVKEKGFASISMIQRYLRIGYNRAARIVETMERQGLIASSDGTSKPREFLKK